MLIRNLKPHHLLIPIALAICLIYAASKAAVTADAYVTFRVVDNFINGFGLRWNIAERVQVYTHPLWMFLHIPLYKIWPNIFQVTIFISALCTAIALALPLYHFRRTPLEAIGLFLLPLTISVSFTDSSFLGLENPLLHALFAWFGWHYFKKESRYYWFFFSLIISLSMTTRLDTALLYFPIAAYAILSRWKSVSFRQLALGMLPIYYWESFSLFYYGFLFPNTKYAKLTNGFLDLENAAQGLHYFLNLFALDITSAFVLSAVVFVIPMFALKKRKHAWISHELVWLSAGVLLYSAYIISIGGTFIAGRFWSLSIYASYWILYAYAPRVSATKLLVLIGVLVVVKAFYPSGKWLRQECSACFQGGIYRHWFSENFDGYLRDSNNKDSRAPAKKPTHGGGKWVAAATGVGFFAYETGSKLHMVNPYAFTDPLLARLPNKGTKMSQSYIEYLARDIPEGYVHALQTGDVSKMEPSLAGYYEKLRIIISGELSSPQRLAEIINFNLGKYDYLRAEYIQNKKPTTPPAPTPKQELH